jgi:hypothetical protein
LKLKVYIKSSYPPGYDHRIWSGILSWTTETWNFLIRKSLTVIRTLSTLHVVAWKSSVQHLLATPRIPVLPYTPNPVPFSTKVEKATSTTFFPYACPFWPVVRFLNSDYVKQVRFSTLAQIEISISPTGNSTRHVIYT